MALGQQRVLINIEDGAHPFSGKAQQAYCDKEKRLEVMAA